MKLKLNKGVSNIKGTFYDSSKYSLLTKVIPDESNANISTDIFDEKMDTDQSDCEDTHPPRKKGRPFKSVKTFLELTSSDRKRKRSQDIYDKMLNFCDTEKLNLDQFLAYIGRRYYLSPGPDFNKEKGQVFNELFNGKEFAYRKSLSPKQGKYLHDSLALGRDKYQVLRKFLGQTTFSLIEKQFSEGSLNLYALFLENLPVS